MNPHQILTQTQPWTTHSTSDTPITSQTPSTKHGVTFYLPPILMATTRKKSKTLTPSHGNSKFLKKSLKDPLLKREVQQAKESPKFFTI